MGGFQYPVCRYRKPRNEPQLTDFARIRHPQCLPGILFCWWTHTRHLQKQPLKHLVELRTRMHRPKSIQAKPTLRSMNDSYRHHATVAAHRTWKMPLFQRTVCGNNRYCSAAGHPSGLVLKIGCCYDVDPAVQI